jgi:hypothetical protein
MSPPRLCARPGCDNPPAPRSAKVGRPPIYCSPTCRPSPTQPGVIVEVERQSDQADSTGHDWDVRVRRGNRVVSVHDSLGRFAAMALATELRSVLGERQSR